MSFILLAIAYALRGQGFDTIRSSNIATPIVILDKARKYTYRIEEVLWTSSPGVAEVRRFVYLDSTKRMLTEVKVPIVYHGKNPVMGKDVRYRLLLCAVNKDDTPGSALAPHNYLLTATSSTFTELVFDISRYDISIPPEGIYVGIEALDTPFGYYDMEREENVKDFTKNYTKLKLVRWGAPYTRLHYKRKAPQTFTRFRHPNIRQGVWQKDTLEDLNCSVVFSE